MVSLIIHYYLTSSQVHNWVSEISHEGIGPGLVMPSNSFFGVFDLIHFWGNFGVLFPLMLMRKHRLEFLRGFFFFTFSISNLVKASIFMIENFQSVLNMVKPSTSQLEPKLNIS